MNTAQHLLVIGGCVLSIVDLRRLQTGKITRTRVDYTKALLQTRASGVIVHCPERAPIANWRISVVPDALRNIRHNGECVKFNNYL